MYDKIFNVYIWNVYIGVDGLLRVDIVRVIFLIGDWFGIVFFLLRFLKLFLLNIYFDFFILLVRYFFEWFKLRFDKFNRVKINI